LWFFSIFGGKQSPTVQSGLIVDVEEFPSPGDSRNFKYLGVILNKNNNHQTDLQETIKNANRTYFMLQKVFRNKNISKKLKL